MGLTFEDDKYNYLRILGLHESLAQDPCSRHSLQWILKWKLSTLRLCLVPEKCERKKIGRKNGRKEKGKEMNIIFFTCLVIHGKVKGKKPKRSLADYYPKSVILHL